MKFDSIEKRDLHNELINFLLAYISTPHIMTGKSRNELLFGRKLRTKLLELVQRSGRESEAQDKDSEYKRKKSCRFEK